MKHLSPTPKIFFFFFNDTATTEIYTLSLHDALPISAQCRSSKKTINGLRRASSRRKALSSRFKRSWEAACSSPRGDPSGESGGTFAYPFGGTACIRRAAQGRRAGLVRASSAFQKGRY